MALIESLLEEIEDADLRARLEQEVRDLKERTDFGLVFERHIPESVCLPASVGIDVGTEVKLRDQPSAESRLFVAKLTKTKATITDQQGENEQQVKLNELQVVRRFTEPIYPTVASIGDAGSGSGSRPHLVINSENYHALQLLRYTHSGRVDVIYIDPPYNTGARNWKYNNSFVDSKDRWRHSKWLAFMEKRLKLAKHLLKDDGVLIVTVDEHEVHHLGMLLEDVFPEYLRYMITIVNAPQGNEETNFSRVEEYAMFCVPDTGDEVIEGSPIDFVPESGEIESEPSGDEDEGEEDASLEELDEPGGDHYLGGESGETRTISENARRRGNESLRADRASMFYPILIDEEKGEVVRVGDPIDLEEEPGFQEVDGLRPIWPIDTNGDHRRWRWGAERMRQLVEVGEIQLGKHNKERDTWAINRVQVKPVEHLKLKTVWRHTSHNAGTHGSGLLSRFLGQGQAFTFPKSVYATRDCLAAACRSRKDAVVLDFFAGSGTTLHSTLLLNQQDEGHRQAILVTNNEVDGRESDKLRKKGLRPGDKDWEKEGVFERACRPRCTAAVTGVRPDGKHVEGKYLNGHPFSEGFEEQVQFLELRYLNPETIEIGDGLDELLPVFWLKSGASGHPPATPKEHSAPFHVFEEQRFAVLLDSNAFADFVDALPDPDQVQRVFLVTDYNDTFSAMSGRLPGRKTEMVPRDYLSWFRKHVGDTQ